MKRFVSVALVALVAIAVAGFYIWSQNGRVWVHSESAGLCLTKGNYRSWQIYYSHGHQLRPDGSWKNLWHRPMFRHTDLLKLLNSVSNTTVTNVTVLDNAHEAKALLRSAAPQASPVKWSPAAHTNNLLLVPVALEVGFREDLVWRHKTPPPVYTNVVIGRVADTSKPDIAMRLDALLDRTDAALKQSFLKGFELGHQAGRAGIDLSNSLQVLDEIWNR